MNTNKFFILFFVVFIALFSCKKQSPQLPANKIKENNDSTLTLLEINKRLAVKEDSLLKTFVYKKSKQFTRSDLGFWYKTDKSATGNFLKINDTCNIDYELKLINGKTVLHESRKIVLGKKDAIPGIENALELLKKGEKATIIIPWYLGYGMKGFEEIIPPYTSLICEIEIKL